MSSPLRAQRWRAWALAGLLVWGGCGRGGQGEAVDPAAIAARTRLRDVSTIEGDFLARQRLTGVMGAVTLSGDVVLQKAGGTLTLLGLSPFGTRAFVVIQEGSSVRVETTPGMEPPFPPAMMLVDVHRALFLGLAPGRRRGRVDGELVEETWSEERLLRRVFTRRIGRPRGKVTIGYGRGMTGGEPPAVIEIVNEQIGYSVTIETLSFQRL